MTNIVSFWRPSIQKFNESKPDLKVDPISLLARTILFGCAYIALSMALAGTVVTPVPLLLALPVVYAYHELENRRAARALDRLAIELFAKHQNVPDYVMKYMTKNPQAVEKLCKLSGENLDKCAYSTGINLFDEILNSPDLREENNFSIFKTLVKNDSHCRFNYKEAFIKFFPSKYALHLLHEKKVQARDFAPFEVITLFNLSHGNSTIELLNYNFDINIKNDQNQTPLYLAILKGNISKVTNLMMHGAQPISLDAKIAQRDNQVISLGEMLDGCSDNGTLRQYSFIKTILQEPYIPTKIRNQKPDSSAFWKPAVEINLTDQIKVFDVNANQIIKRTIALAATIYAVGLSVIVCMPLISPLLVVAAFFSAVLLIPSLWYQYEYSRSSKKLAALAIEEFKRSHPEHAVMKHIVKNEKIIDELIKQGLDISKLDSMGNTLLSILCNKSFNSGHSISTQLAIFKKLVDKNFENNLSTIEKNKCFFAALNSGHLEYIDYLLASGKFDPRDLNSQQQFRFFNSIFTNAFFQDTVKQKIEILKLMIAKGGDVNARNNENKTILQCLNEMKTVMQYSKGSNGYNDIIRFLEENQAG
jgi:ankyrin repeat protein